MRLRDRIRSGVEAFMTGRNPALSSLALADPFLPADFVDLPLRAETSTQEALTLTPAAGLIDSDDYAFRRLSSGVKFKRRDLTPMQQDRMLEIAWYLYESNPFARRIITAMTDIIVGEGVGFEAKDPKLQEAGDKVWHHPINQLGQRARELHNALSLNGELILPVGLNDVSGVPTVGFIDPYQVERIEPRVDNVMVADTIILKRSPSETTPRTLKIVQANPVTGRLEGECFYVGINKLPNSTRGRSDFMPLADWLDLFDQYVYAEAERVRLLGAFVWDLKMTGANAQQIKQRLTEIGTPQSGSVFGHNENETLEAASPQLNAKDSSDTAKLLTVHIAGSMGMPPSWFGWDSGSRGTADAQNDVAMKTPAARQKEFGAFLNLIVRFGIEAQRVKNPVLFRDTQSDKFAVMMPEIAAKDLTRVGTALAQIAAALDTAMANKTMSRRAAVVIQCAITKHLGSGIEFKPEDIMAEADKDAEERQGQHDDLLAQFGAQHAAGPGGHPNPPIRGVSGEPRLTNPDGGNDSKESIADLPVLG